MIYTQYLDNSLSGLNEAVQNIESRLDQLSREAEMHGALNRNTLLSDAEKFFEEFLNALYGWELESANVVQHNAPGVDLVFKGGKTVVQVSGRSDKRKLLDSLEKTSKDYKKDGFHFVFVTTQFKHTEYKKEYYAEFDAKKGGLVFDCRRDVLDVRTLARQVRAADSGKVEELSGIADRFFKRRRTRDELGLLPLGSGGFRSIFEFNSGYVDFFGREKESEELSRFISGNEPFKWFAIAAPGGSGKTRLAYELQNKLTATGEWTCVRLADPAWDRLDELEELYWGNTLFIADYAASHTAQLGRWIKKLSQPGYKRDHPIRLLLLDRDIKDRNDCITWFDSILSADRAKIRQLGPKKAYLLGTIGGGDGEAMLRLIRSFADRIAEASEEGGERITKLPPGFEGRIRSKLCEIDSGFMRPLYAMILTDAWMRDPAAEGWTREELLEYIVDRETAFMEERIKPFHDPENRTLFESCRFLWMASTVLCAGGRMPFEMLSNLMPDDANVLSFHAKLHEAALFSKAETPAVELLRRAGLYDNGCIMPMTPDILGEYFVLSGLRDAGNAQRSELWRAILSNADFNDMENSAAFIFFARMLKDHFRLFEADPGLGGLVFPTEPELGGKLDSRYGRLLKLLFGDQNKRSMRHVLAGSLLEYAEGRKDETKYDALVFGAAGFVCAELGDYDGAYGYYDRALAIHSRLCAEDNPEVAAICNGIAKIHLLRGEFDKAIDGFRLSLEMHKKVCPADDPNIAVVCGNLALAYKKKCMFAPSDELKLLAAANYRTSLDIFEKRYGTDHPMTATAYNNFGAFYTMIGDSSCALEYYEKALRIRERAFGTEHPETSETYNNIGALYKSLGNYGEAHEYYSKALAINEAVFGSDHTRTATSCHNLGMLLLREYRPAEALPYLCKALAIRGMKLGEQSPETEHTRKMKTFAERLITLSEEERKRLTDKVFEAGR